MLRERIITAVVLVAALVLAVLAASPVPFAALTLVMIAAGGWEWSRLCGLGSTASVVAGLVLALVLALVGPLGYGLEIPVGVWLAVAAVWIVGGALALRAGPDGFLHLNRPLRFIIGWLLLFAAGCAFVAARERGIAFLASVCVLVWVADIFAYFGGRALGRRKLAPTISPGKSWEGAWSGLAAVLVLAVLVVAMVPERTNLFGMLQSRGGWAGLVAACAGLVALAIVGDLSESLAKRAAGAKDSSRLLPGHGGVLDRIDALLPVFPAALAIVMTL
jgi:phosphatidate cytidylyltransferase